MAISCFGNTTGKVCGCCDVNCFGFESYKTFDDFVAPGSLAEARCGSTTCGRANEKRGVTYGVWRGARACRHDVGRRLMKDSTRIKSNQKMSLPFKSYEAS